VEGSNVRYWLPLCFRYFWFFDERMPPKCQCGEIVLYTIHFATSYLSDASLTGAAFWLVKVARRITGSDGECTGERVRYLPCANVLFGGIVMY